ncbi:hypothetical protein ACVILJ_006094 [Bradyrhizobium diazoefficiens]|nr:gastric chitinase [Bradyrhizobium diazoefficiens]
MRLVQLGGSKQPAFNGERIFNLSTYAVNYSKENGKLLVKITTYNKDVRDVSKSTTQSQAHCR